MLFVVLSAAALHIPASAGRRAAALSGAAALSSFSLGNLLLPPQPALAEEATVPCPVACFKECNSVAPGNEGYCRTQCDDYCASEGPTGSADVLRSDVTASAAAAAGKDCSTYKTDKGRACCQAENAKAAQAAIQAAKPKTGLEMNNGIFGDSGVAYSKGVEDLFATAFGATRQNKSVKDADLGGFASDIGDAARRAVIGQ